MDYFDISKTRLTIPELWKKDWDALIEETDKEMRVLPEAQKRIAFLFKDIDDNSFTFGRAAWLCLTTRLFNISNAVVGACHSNSDLLFDVLQRIFLEYWFQVYTMALPKSLEKRRDYLNAYAAWSLDCDLMYQKYLLKPSVMDGIWDIEEEKEYIESSEEEKLIREKLFGPTNTEKLTADYHEAQKRKMDHKSEEYKKRERIKKWLKHEDVKLWTERINTIRRKRRNPNLSFYELFDKSQTSFYQKIKSKELSDKDLEFLYAEYKKSSMKIHGSSFLDNFIVNPKILFPKIMGDSDSNTEKAILIGSMATSLFFPLLFLKKAVWPKSSN